MMSSPRLVAVVVSLAGTLAQAQTAPAAPPASAPASAPAAAPGSDAVAPSALTSELFYQLLLGEISLRSGEAGAGFSLLLDAARKTGDPALYQRCVEVALQLRNGDAALQAARAWRQAHPGSRDANRYLLQILIALGRVSETPEAMKSVIATTPADQRAAAIATVPRLFARATDRKAATAAVEQGLADAAAQRATASAAWTAIGRMRLAAADPSGALEAARRGQAAADPDAEGPALLAVELMAPNRPEAEAIVRQHLAQRPSTEFSLLYARVLMDYQRQPEALRQVERVTREKPDNAEAWLLLGQLQAQENQNAAAEESLKKYLGLSATLPQAERERGQAQAHLALSRLAEKRRDFALAQAWLDKIDSAQELVGTTTQRASLLARQGRLDEARQLIRNLPERTPGAARVKLMAEVQLLRDQKQYQAAYDLLTTAAAQDPKDHELLYDQAMMAEKLGSLGEMERLLRQIIALKPDYQHAYNALGYSLADRNVRLAEARDLIRKALELAPGDPYITDSLGWVEFRMGNRAEALRILEGAYKDRPDAEIAAHLGEVLWVMGQRDRARAIWREGLLLNPENETLQETLKRLGVRP